MKRLELGESKYIVGREITCSEHARVFGGYAVGTRDKVAIKLPKDEEGDLKLTAEAYWMNQLYHENLVTFIGHGLGRAVTTLGKYDTLATTSYYAGPDLERRCQSEGPLTVGAAVTLASHIAEGLDYIHSQGVLHRDVKPANVMSIDGKTWLLGDFDTVAPMSEAHLSMAGTLPYVAPEQVYGKAGVRSDVYSLAMTTYAAMEPRQREQLPIDEIREEVEGVILKGVSPLPMERPSSAGHLAHELLEAYAKGLASKASRLKKIVIDLGRRSLE